jgi:hypothetical protein
MQSLKHAPRCVCALAGIVVTLGFVSQASATLVGGAPVLTPISATTGTWSPGPSYLSLPASGLSIASANTAQGNTTPAGTATQTAMAETFTPGSSTTFGAPNSSGFALGKVAVIAGGGSTGNVASMHLYAVNLPPSSSASASYNDGIQGHLVGPDLLGAGAGLSFPWNPGNAGTGNVWLAEFNLDGTDNVPLVPGQMYALEFWSSNPVSAPNSNNFIWFRGADTGERGGQMFGAHNADLLDATNGVRLTINQLGQAGGAPRHASLALYAVPEPGSLGLIAVAVTCAVARRRRRPQ